MAKLQISLDKSLSSGKVEVARPGEPLAAVRNGSDWGSLPTAVEAAQQLVPSLASLLELLTRTARAKVIETFQETAARGVEPGTGSSLLHCVSLAGTRCPATASLALPVTAHLPPALRAALEDWAAASIAAFPPVTLSYVYIPADTLYLFGYLDNRLKYLSSFVSSLKF